jgi:hypothetical protein
MNTIKSTSDSKKPKFRLHEHPWLAIVASIALWAWFFINRWIPGGKTLIGDQPLIVEAVVQ